MKKNLYYREMFQRRNVIKEGLLNLFTGLTSFGRLIIEVFIRKNMGRRYFKFSESILTALSLFIVPFLPMVFSFARSFGERLSFWGTIKEYWMWYVFIGIFLYFSYLRYKDVKHLKAQFDMEHFSLSSGDTLPFYLNLKMNGKPFSIRTLEVFIEPLPFFIGGLFFLLIGFKLLGALFIFSSIIYCISYARAYMIGDHFIMDKIDEVICNEQLSKVFVKDEPASKGFRFYGEKPESEPLREEAFKHFFEDDDDFSEVN
ncbi:hypothetical protein [Flavobacterium sp. UBA4197]|uniref:hypothetical protein n=1 Tax=Flavobacterium sp. UBA4197 TaxID=1946546 RepID=UPI00257F08AA|nr:hypothetical protein [Flavobacterium sp. UBA4197]